MPPKKKPRKRKTLADVLREAVLATGEPVSTIALAAGVPQPVLHRFMAGERDLTLRVADRLAKHFKLTLR